MRLSTRILLTKIIGVVLAVGVVAGAAAGITSIVRHANEELKTIHPTFKVGGLNAQGKYVESEDTLYTKEAFECRGLEISLSFENDINYQVFYYDEVGTFLESTEVLDSKYTLDSFDVIEATHARVMIIPQWSNLEATEDKTIEEQKVINWRNKGSFVDQMTIKVAKDQEFGEVSSFTLATSSGNLTFNFVEGMTWDEFLDSEFSSSNGKTLYTEDEVNVSFEGNKVYLNTILVELNDVILEEEYATGQ